MPKHKAKLEEVQQDLSQATNNLDQLDCVVPGEELKGAFTDTEALLEGASTTMTHGTMYITNFQLIFTKPTENDKEIPLYIIPLGTISRVKGKKKKDQIEVFCKHSRHLSILFPNKQIKEEAYTLLQRYAFPSSTHQVFAFVYNAFDDGFDPISFTLEDDYKRIGFDKAADLRLLDNSDFSYCDTYPASLVVPASFSDEQIKQVSSFRSRGRIPAAVWKHPDNGALLVRCSQPCVGFKGNHCNLDDKMLHAYKNQQQKIIYIMDSRPKANAVANMLRGGGYEMSKYYKNFQLEFNNIENIHVMRNSLLGVYKFALGLQLDSDPINEKNQPEELAETHWFFHLRLVLESVARVIELTHHQACSVVVHCSDGWDRTAQTIATAEILSDPYYRTIHGFLCLIEKEWVQFGHQFALRYGHSEGSMENYKESQRSPIFPQWLDILHQLLLVFPTAFEFNELLLLTLMDELYSCRYGTFLFDSHKQRVENQIFSRTKSLWSFILAHSDFYRNPIYKADPSILTLDLSNVTLCLWHSYFVNFHRLGAPHPYLENNSDNKAQPDVLVPKKKKKKKRSSTRRSRRSTVLGEQERMPKKRTSTLSVLPSPRRKRNRSSRMKQNPVVVPLEQGKEPCAPSPKTSKRATAGEKELRAYNFPPPPKSVLSPRSEPNSPVVPPRNKLSTPASLHKTTCEGTEYDNSSTPYETETDESLSILDNNDKEANTIMSHDETTNNKEEYYGENHNPKHDEVKQESEEYLPEEKMDSSILEVDEKPPPIPPVDKEILNQQFEYFQKTLHGD